MSPCAGMDLTQVLLWWDNLISCKINPFYHSSMTRTCTSRADIPDRSPTTKHCAWGVCLPWDERLLLLTVASSQAAQTRKIFSASLLEMKVKISRRPTALVMCKISCCKGTHSASQRISFCHGTAINMHPPVGFSSGWHQSQHRCSYLCTLKRQLMSNGAFSTTTKLTWVLAAMLTNQLAMKHFGSKITEYDFNQ